MKNGLLSLLELRHDSLANVVLAQVRLDILETELNKAGENFFSRFYLSEREQQAFSGYTFRKRKLEWLGGRIAAKYAAKKILFDGNMSGSPVEWKDFELIANKQGKPFIQTGKQVTAEKMPEISISHSGNLAVAMADAENACGIDVQVISSTVVKVRERFSSTEERRILKKFDAFAAVGEEAGLTLLWSAKEALRKAIETNPLAGFMELCLTAAAGDPSEGVLFEFIHERGKEERTRFAVVAFFYEEYVVAFTTTPF